MIWAVLIFAALINQIKTFGVWVGGNNSTASITNTTFTIVEDVDQNKCLCDVQYNICDMNCCCDPLCDAATVTAWKSASYCKENEIIDALDQFKCAGFTEYTSRLINKVYEVDCKL